MALIGESHHRRAVAHGEAYPVDRLRSRRHGRPSHHRYSSQLYARETMIKSSHWIGWHQQPVPEDAVLRHKMAFYLRLC